MSRYDYKCAITLQLPEQLPTLKKYVKLFWESGYNLNWYRDFCIAENNNSPHYLNLLPKEITLCRENVGGLKLYLRTTFTEYDRQKTERYFSDEVSFFQHLMGEVRIASVFHRPKCCVTGNTLNYTMLELTEKPKGSPLWIDNTIKDQFVYSDVYEQPWIKKEDALFVKYSTDGDCVKEGFLKIDDIQTWGYEISIDALIIKSTAEHWGVRIVGMSSPYGTPVYARAHRITEFAKKCPCCGAYYEKNSPKEYCPNCENLPRVKCDVCHEYEVLLGQHTVYVGGLSKPTKEISMCPRCQRHSNKLIGLYKNRPWFVSEFDGSVRSEHVHGYHSTSSNWRLLSSAYDEQHEQRIGFELEVENTKNFVSNDTMATFINTKYPEMFTFQRDGSLNDGFEIISQPFTKGYYIENYKKFMELCEDLAAFGYESHEPNTCGLHVHMSYAEQSSSDFPLGIEKSAKIAYIIESFRAEFKRHSRRNNFEYCQFASRTYSSLERALEQSTTACLSMLENNLGYFTDHSTAFNVRASSRTAELRIYRGTLAPSSFISALNMAFSLLEVAKKENFTLTFAELAKMAPSQELAEHSKIYFEQRMGGVSESQYRKLTFGTPLQVNEIVIEEPQLITVHDAMGDATESSVGDNLSNFIDRFVERIRRNNEDNLPF